MQIEVNAYQFWPHKADGPPLVWPCGRGDHRMLNAIGLNSNDFNDSHSSFIRGYQNNGCFIYFQFYFGD